MSKNQTQEGIPSGVSSEIIPKLEEMASLTAKTVDMVQKCQQAIIDMGLMVSIINIIKAYSVIDYKKETRQSLIAMLSAFNRLRSTAITKENAEEIIKQAQAYPLLSREFMDSLKFIHESNKINGVSVKRLTAEERTEDLESIMKESGLDSSVLFGKTIPTQQ